MLDAGRGVEHGLDRFDHGDGIARRIGAVDAHQRPAEIDELGGARLDARLPGAGAQSRPRVAAVQADRTRIPVTTPAATDMTGGTLTMNFRTVPSLPASYRS